MTDIEILHAITAPTRYRMLLLLLDHHYCVKALAEKLGISEPAVSQQMRVLKECGVVTGKRIDYQMHYMLNHELVLRVGSSFGTSIADYIALQKKPEECDCEFADVCNRRREAKQYE